MERRVVLYPWPATEPPAVPAGARVVTPNDRAAERLGLAGGRQDSLVSLAHAQLQAAGLGVAPPIAAHRALAEAATDAFPAAEVTGLAAAWAPALRSLFHAGADLTALTQDVSPRVRRVAALARAYQARLRAQNLVDGAEALFEAARRTPEPQVLFVHGYARLGTDEVIFLDAIAAPSSVVRLPYGTPDAFSENMATAEVLAARGWTIERPAALPDAPFAPLAARAAAHAFANREEEVRHVLATIKGLLADGTPPGDITLVVRDDTDYGPLVLAIAWEYQVPLRALYAVPLAETRLGVWLEQVLVAAGDGLPYEATFRALDHVLGPRLASDAWVEARRKRPTGADEWRAVGADVDLLCWPTEDSRAGWVARLRGLFSTWGVRKRAARWPRELIGANTLLEALKSLEAPITQQLSREAFADELREALRMLTAPAQPGRGGVTLHTPFALYGAAFSHVFVLGLAEGVMPTPVSNDPALDFHERRALAERGIVLEDAIGAARRERLSFLALLAAAPAALTLSYARQNGGREVGPSAYFRELGLRPGVPAAAPVASAEVARRSWAVADDGQADGLTARIRHSLAVERGREGDGPPDEYDGVVGIPLPADERVFSATQLTALGQCPFKWFAGKALRLEAPDEAEDDLTPAKRGSLYHKALELAATDLPEGEDVRAVMLARLEDAFLAAERELELPTLPAWQERRLEHLATLRQSLAAPDFLAPDAAIFALEKTFEGEWYGLRVQGRVDRVDRHADGALTFIDYKTGSSVPTGAQNAQGKANVDVQLPLYVAVAAPHIAPGALVRQAYYYSLTKGKVLKRVADASPALEALAERIKRRLAEGDFPVAPDVDEAACTYCDHALVCRRGPRLARKNTFAVVAEGTEEMAE